MPWSTPSSPSRGRRTSPSSPTPPAPRAPDAARRARAHGRADARDPAAHRRRARRAPASSRSAVMPHGHAHVLADLHQAASRSTCSSAIAAAPRRAREWAACRGKTARRCSCEAAELLAGPWRTTLNAATMLGQSKTAHQAEIDAACELIDFLRFNVHFAQQLYREQPQSAPGMWNQLELPPARGLRVRGHAVQLHGDRRQPADGAGADGQHGGVEAGATRDAQRRTYIMRAARGGGLPPGVINLVPGDGAAIGDPRRSRTAISPASTSPARPACSTACGSTVGENIARYRATRAWSARPAARTSSSRTRRADVDGARRRRLVRGALRVPGAEVLGGLRAPTSRASLWPSVREQLRRA